VAIVLPSLGAPVVWPADSIPEALLGELVQYALAAAAGAPGSKPAAVAHAVPIRIGSDVVGVVAAVRVNGTDVASEATDWLEAAAAAAAVTRLMDDGRRSEQQDSRRALLRTLVSGVALDPTAVAADGRRLGVDLGAGAIVICARAAGDGAVRELPVELAEDGAAVIGELDPGYVLALVPLAGEHPERDAGALAERLGTAGFEAAVSAPRREPALLREAAREAMLLAELACAPEAALAGQEETYRLLIGVLLRDPEELELLQSSTITPVLAYDSEHDTELLVTLGTFLAHHGSTTETAEVMGLHRHTVGYRLSRVHEVSGLSPYESDGRERLSLGLKAAQILAAAERI
jgi:PucR family transcriptional regulator, purine catabolism regulatory protein